MPVENHRSALIAIESALYGVNAARLSSLGIKEINQA
jgi:hypothetical protein